MAETAEYRRAKRTLLANFVDTLSMSEDMWPDEIAANGPQYQAWRRAHDDLRREFERRALGDGFTAPPIRKGKKR